MYSVIKISFLLLFTSACDLKQKQQSKYSSVLLRADEVHISFKFKDRISTVKRKDKNIPILIDEVLSEKDEKCSCEDTGFLGVYKNDTLLLDISVSTSNTGGNDSCQFLMLDEGGVKKCYRLTYRMGMYLDETYNHIKPE